MKQNLKIISNVLDTIDLKELWQYGVYHDFIRFFNLKSGSEHYRLLSNFSWQFPAGTTLIDIGTSCGFSALALSHNPNVKVISYNIQDDIGTQVCSAKNKENIELRIANCLDEIDVLLQSPLIMLDTAHLGDFEKEVITALLNNNYKGIVICDDIYLNSPMVQFWNWVPIEKQDITQFGHWSGTGVILFDKNTIDIEILTETTPPKPPMK